VPDPRRDTVPVTTAPATPWPRRRWRPRLTTLPTTHGCRQDSGKLVLGDWQEPVSVWYGEYDTSAADVEAFGPSLGASGTSTADYKYYGQLATNVPTVSNGGVKLTSSGGMDVTINLRPAANWSDGQPITCDDLAYQVQWQSGPPARSATFVGIRWVEDITSVDGGTDELRRPFFKRSTKATSACGRRFCPSIPSRPSRSLMHPQALRPD